MNERERIELLIKNYELSPSQFADRAGIQRASVSHILSGRNKPSLEIMQKICEAFPSVDAKWLILGYGEAPVKGGLQAPDEGFGGNTLFSVSEPKQTAAIELQPDVPAYGVTAKAVEKPTVNTSKPQIERAPKRQQRQVQQHVAPVLCKKIKEVRVYYTDGTYEILLPEK